LLKNYNQKTKRQKKKEIRAENGDPPSARGEGKGANKKKNQYKRF